MNRIMAFIERASLIYYARIVEGCAALTLIGLAIYISDERVLAYGLVRSPSGVPIHTAKFILIAAGVAQLVGITMPLIHEWFRHRGFKSRWLNKVWLNEKTWRICAMVVAIALWGAYAGLMSAGSWAAWLFAGSFSLLLTISIFRLEAQMDADRDRSRHEPVFSHDTRESDDAGPLSHTDYLEVAHAPPKPTPIRCTGNLSA